MLAGAIALCSAGGKAETTKVEVSSRVEIKGPVWLAGDLTHHGALFGKNYFGQTMENIMYYTKRPLCDGQLPDTPAYIKQQGYFLLVDRGECSFVEKIRNAQKDGAAAVFIADDRCLCSEDGLCETNVEEVCEKFEPFMDDDGTGSDINIPSMLLLKSDADRLREEIVSGSVVETSISFPVPKASNGQTNYMLFTTPGDPGSQQFLDSFLEAAIGFGSKAVFQPRMMLSDGTQKGCRQYDDSHSPCKGHCSNYGRYCEAPTTFDKAHYDNKGTKVMVESMRRTCIWNIYGKVDGIGKEWWAYNELWNLQCSYSQYSTSCAESVYDAAGIDKEEVETCMENSGNFRENVQNTLMETSMSDIEKYQVKFAPTLVVNGAVLNGAVSFGSAMTAICSTFEELDRPDICDKWDVCADKCSKDESCILWGDKQECSAYRAPNLGNEGKEFDDDYLNLGLDPVTDTAPEIPSSDLSYEETEIPKQQEWSYINDDAKPVYESTIESSVDWSDGIPTLQKVEDVVPPNVLDPQFIPQTSVEVSPHTAENKEIRDEKHDFVETIEIFEGSSSDLAIGLGVGFGAAFLLLFVWFMMSREREHRVDDFMGSGRMRRRGRRSLLKSRRRYYDDYSDDSSSSRETYDDSYDDEFSDEEEYYNDRRRARYYTKHRKRDRRYSKKSGRKSKLRLPRRKGSPGRTSERSEEEVPFTRRSRSIHRQIDADDFSSKEYENEEDLKSKAFVGGKKYDDEDDNEDE